MQPLIALQAEFSVGLIHLSRAWRRAIDKSLEEYGLSESTAWTLLQISRAGGGMRQVVLAETLGIVGPSLVRLLDQLCEGRLVERREDQADRRAKTIYLTEAGAALSCRIEGVLDAVRANLLADVSPDDLATCQRVFRSIGATLGRSYPQPAHPAGTGR
ncbi:MAG: MarR family winged helix-turn-helix transcriptional regulator [Janthinobacterium lividum]